MIPHTCFSLIRGSTLSTPALQTWVRHTSSSSVTIPYQSLSKTYQKSLDTLKQLNYAIRISGLCGIVSYPLITRHHSSSFLIALVAVAGLGSPHLLSGISDDYVEKITRNVMIDPLSLSADKTIQKRIETLMQKNYLSITVSSSNIEISSVENGSTIYDETIIIPSYMLKLGNETLPQVLKNTRTPEEAIKATLQPIYLEGDKNPLSAWSKTPQIFAFIDERGNLTLNKTHSEAAGAIKIGNPEDLSEPPRND